MEQGDVAPEDRVLLPGAHQFVHALQVFEVDVAQPDLLRACVAAAFAKFPRFIATGMIEGGRKYLTELPDHLPKKRVNLGVARREHVSVGALRERAVL